MVGGPCGMDTRRRAYYLERIHLQPHDRCRTGIVTELSLNGLRTKVSSTGTLNGWFPLISLIHGWEQRLFPSLSTYTVPH